MLTIEYTDTFGGEANYCWVKRWQCRFALSDRRAVALAKKLAGLTGVRCRREDQGETIALYPRGICQVIFISYCEATVEFGKEVSPDGEEVARA